MSQRLDSTTSAAPGHCAAGVLAWVALGLVLAFSGPLDAHAQSAPVIQQGTAFVNSIAPKSASQLVNPAAVNPAAWGHSTATPAAVLPNLGGFSQPVTSNAAYTAAKTGGLTPLGTQAMVDCSTFVPGPNANPLQVQACAAINFMTNNCMTPTNQQGAVLSRVGASQIAGSNCAGTYGAGAQTFNLQNQITPTDPVFTVMKNLGATAPAAVSAICSTQNVVSTPTQYATNLCAKDINTTAQTCSQFLKAAVAPSQGSCATGSSLLNIQFAGPVHGPDYATIKATCNPAGGPSAIPFTFDGWGSDGSCSGPLHVTVDMTSPEPQGINPPPALGQIVPSWLVDCMPITILWTGAGCSAGTPSLCTGTFHFVQSPGTVTSYSCPAGQTSGTQILQLCGDSACSYPTPADPGSCYQGYASADLAGSMPTQYGQDASGNFMFWAVVGSGTPVGWSWAPGVHLQQAVSFVAPKYLPPQVTTSWSDACAPYEASAGITLPTP